MPRIRDLGISHIPATMRPPEIGPGGAFDLPAAPDAGFPMYLTCTACSDDTYQCPNSCEGSSHCPTNTCDCQRSCVDSQQGGEGYHQLGGLTDEAIIQLKQHLQDRMGTQFQM